MNRNFLISRTSLVLLGIALGYLARAVLGVPSEAPGPERAIDRELVDTTKSEIDLPIINRPDTPAPSTTD